MRYIIECLLKFLSRRVIKKYDPDIIGITGSTGKTDVKKFAARILSSKFKVDSNAGGQNTRQEVLLAVLQKQGAGKSFFSGLALLFSTLRLWLKDSGSYPDIFIFEMTASGPGDLRYLSSIVQCQIGVVTSVSSASEEMFKTTRKINRENRWMMSCLPNTGFAILNRDEEDVFSMAKKTEADVITYGLHPESDVRASDICVKDNGDESGQGLMFKVTYRGSMVPMFLPGVVSEDIIHSVLAAIAVSLVCGINLVEISRALKGQS